ncbi:hypothetical protein Q4Q35_00070 [Flavivirga aquimarina]|uniref:Lipoprotein n=1 Tax=Flavivirga aquimarina TaxID=2027862 RepID=A0ABT8W502_9FLAO|nr:hypothetical protein [Flavivirga aquimarina]MDO5968191.1 hypothetical protein [Flavivirga aquimarina]
MKRLLVIIWGLVFSCVEDKKLDSSFFYNTRQTIIEKKCAPLSKDGRIWAYEIYDKHLLYNCDSDVDRYTSMFIIKNKQGSIINEISYPYELYPWLIGYDDVSLYSFKNIKDEPEKTELISIDLRSGTLTSLTNLPKGHYDLSEHSISENGILVFISKGLTHIFDIQNKKLSLNLFKSNYQPVISKDGKQIVYLLDKKVYVYDILNNEKEMIYDLATVSQYSPFYVYFKNQNEFIVKGIKYDDILPLKESEYLVIKNKEIVDRGQLDIYGGYKYY